MVDHSRPRRPPVRSISGANFGATVRHEHGGNEGGRSIPNDVQGRRCGERQAKAKCSQAASVINHGEPIIVAATAAGGCLEALEMRGVVRARNDGGFFEKGCARLALALP
jgi:hypothetical protein